MGAVYCFVFVFIYDELLAEKMGQYFEVLGLNDVIWVVYPIILLLTILCVINGVFPGTKTIKNEKLET